MIGQVPDSNRSRNLLGARRSVYTLRSPAHRAAAGAILRAIRIPLRFEAKGRMRGCLAAIRPELLGAAALLQER
jgi:hypothetical protein